MIPVRLMFDARMARHGGIGTYIRSLLGALSASGAVEHGCVLGDPEAGHGGLSPAFCRRPFGAPVYSLREQLALPAPRHATPLWHSPHYNIPLRWRGPMVVTVHDLIHISRPQDARSPWAASYTAFMLRRIAARRAAVIAVSEATKQVVCARTDTEPTLVSVIPHGADPAMASPVSAATLADVQRRCRIQPPYVLWVSTVRPHKNPLTAIRAFARLRHRRKIPHQLVMAGPTVPWYPTPQREAVTLGLEDAVRWIGPTTRDDLIALYQGASALVMPSYAEGFGLPVLEAMAAGCPVLVSAIPALIELVDDQSVAIHPDDIDGWSDRLYNILFNDQLRTALRTHGRRRAEQFTWERSAAHHLDVYRNALLGRRAA